VRIVGSLTTLPNRIGNIDPTLINILRQQKKLDVLYLNIPDKTLKGDEYNIPEGYEDRFNNISKTKFVINRCGKDLGPLTKLAPVLYIETDPDTIIYIFDDDVLIHRDVVELLYNKSLIYPKCCVGFSGVCVGFFPFYYQSAIDNEEDVEVDWLQGVHVVLYKRNMFGDPIDLIKFGDNTWVKDYLVFNDDHRISGYLNSVGKKMISVGYNAQTYIQNIDEYNFDALSKRGLVWLKEHHEITSCFMENCWYKRDHTVQRSVLFFMFIMVIFGITFGNSIKNAYTEYNESSTAIFISAFLLVSAIVLIKYSIFFKSISSKLG
jgi:hypothetical protein